MRAAALAALLTATAPQVAAIELGSPIDCPVPDSCLVQNFVDVDPGPAAADHACAGLTYDGHKGVDVRLPDLAAMAGGIAVLAAAPGVVSRVRDGEPDDGVARDGRACGNGVVIAHDGGWETQYCHLRQGSVTARPGQAVAAGEAIGLVGLSGLTEFPHVHFSVRDPQGHVVDPHTGLGMGAGCDAAPDRPLWSAAAAQALAHRAPALLVSGFTGAASDHMAVIDGAAPRAPAARDAPTLVFFARAIGLAPGDVMRMTLRGPEGFAPTRTATEPMVRHRAQQALFVGRRRPSGGFPAGRYEGRVVIERAGAAAMDQTFTISLR